MRQILLAILLVACHVVPAVAATSDPDALFAVNARPAMLHTIEDYLATVSLEWIPETQRSELIAKNKPVFIDTLTTASDTYSLKYKFRSEYLLVDSVLRVFSDETSSRLESRQSVASLIEGIQGRGLKAEPISASAPEGDAYDFYIIRNATGEAVGNHLQIRRGVALYIVQVGGAGAFEDVAAIMQFMGSKADAALAFRPKLREDIAAIAAAQKATRSAGARTSTERAVPSGGSQGLGFLLLLGYLGIYVAGRFVAWALNWLIRPRRVGGHVFGVIAVLIATCCLTVLHVNFFTAPVPGRPPLSEKSMDTMTGFAIGLAIWPAVVALVGLTIVRHMRHERRAKPPSGNGVAAMNSEKGDAGN